MMKKAILPLVMLAAIGCNNQQKAPTAEELSLARIDSLEAIAFSEKEKINAKVGMQLIKEYAHYYQGHKQDSLAVDYLFKAAEVSMGMGQGNLAVKYFETINKDHSEFAKAPEALFLCGFTEENINSDTADARRYYEKFIEKYPNHELAEDARFSIQNMSLSDEELIKLFQQNVKEES
jgi:outer membrane protein assembly factor BamD (BamD/ComL family)